MNTKPRKYNRQIMITCTEAEKTLIENTITAIYGNYKVSEKGRDILIKWAKNHQEEARAATMQRLGIAPAETSPEIPETASSEEIPADEPFIEEPAEPPATGMQQAEKSQASGEPAAKKPRGRKKKTAPETSSDAPKVETGYRLVNGVETKFNDEEIENTKKTVIEYLKKSPMVTAGLFDIAKATGIYGGLIGDTIQIHRDIFGYERIGDKVTLAEKGRTTAPENPHASMSEAKRQVIEERIDRRLNATAPHGSSLDKVIAEVGKNYTKDEVITVLLDNPKYKFNGYSVEFKR